MQFVVFNIFLISEPILHKWIFVCTLIFANCWSILGQWSFLTVDQDGVVLIHVLNYRYHGSFKFWKMYVVETQDFLSQVQLAFTSIIALWYVGQASPSNWLRERHLYPWICRSCRGGIIIIGEMANFSQTVQKLINISCLTSGSHWFLAFVAPFLAPFDFSGLGTHNIMNKRSKIQGIGKFLSLRLIMFIRYCFLPSIRCVW